MDVLHVAEEKNSLKPSLTMVKQVRLQNSYRLEKIVPALVSFATPVEYILLNEPA